MIRKRSTLQLIAALVLLLLAVACNGDNGGQQQQKTTSSLTKMASDTVSVLKNSYRSSWGKVKTIIRDMQLQFSPPNLDFKSEDAKAGGGAAKDKVIGAAEKSVEVTKSAVEDTAQSAAKAVETTVQKTAEKVKGSTGDKSSHQEL
ncbi:hypothetical protein LINPERHAP1_LOCUS33817 [Linum perenne]